MSPRMRLISILLPSRVIEELDWLVGEGYFGSRSEAIRHAISVMLMTIKMSALKEAEGEGEEGG